MQTILRLALVGTTVAALQRPASFMRGSRVAQISTFVCRDGVCLTHETTQQRPQHTKHGDDDDNHSWIEESINTPRQGSCQWFDVKKGYGFISMVIPGFKIVDVFFHHSDVSWPQQHGYHSILSGAPLEFKLARNRDSGKFKAMRVTAPDGEPVRDSSEWMADFDEMFGI